MEWAPFRELHRHPREEPSREARTRFSAPWRELPKLGVEGSIAGELGFELSCFEHGTVRREYAYPQMRFEDFVTARFVRIVTFIVLVEHHQDAETHRVVPIFRLGGEQAPARLADVGFAGQSGDRWP